MVSTYATHIGMLCSAYWAAHNHLDHKLNVPSRTYNATVTHLWQILGNTCGHPTILHDTTIILYNNLVKYVNYVDYFSDNEFTLFESDGNKILSR